MEMFGYKYCEVLELSFTEFWALLSARVNRKKWESYAMEKSAERSQAQSEVNSYLQQKKADLARGL